MKEIFFLRKSTGRFLHGMPFKGFLFSFQKQRWSCDIPPRKTPVAQKHSVISGQEKMAFSTPRWVALGLLSSSPRGCTGVRAYADVTTKILGSIGYQLCLAMVLHYYGNATSAVYQSEKNSSLDLTP